MMDETMEMTLHFNIEARQWWRRLGMAGALIAYVGLRIGVPLEAFFKVNAT